MPDAEDPTTEEAKRRALYTKYRDEAHHAWEQTMRDEWRKTQQHRPAPLSFWQQIVSYLKVLYK